MEQKASWSQQVFLTWLPLSDLQLKAISRIQPLWENYDYGVNLKLETGEIIVTIVQTHNQNWRLN